MSFPDSSCPFILAQWLVFANGPGDESSIPGRAILKTEKMVLDVSLAL